MDDLIPKEEKEGLPEKEMPTQDNQKPDDSAFKDIPTEDTPKPPKEEEEETRIPRRRFDKVYGERQEWERRATESEERVKRLEDMLEKSLTASQQRQIERATPDKWKEILGADNPLTDKFYSLLDEEMSAREQRAAERALQQWEERQKGETTRFSQNVERLQEEHEDFADSVGIDPDTEQGDAAMARILEIQDEETPVGEDGKYSQPLIPLATAYRIYKREQAQTSNPQKQLRQRASEIVGSGRGEIDTSRNPAKGRPDPSGWRRFLS